MRIVGLAAGNLTTLLAMLRAVDVNVCYDICRRGRLSALLVGNGNLQRLTR